ncbi:MAG: CoA pyrophosphatase [Roseivirga sp.]
MAPRPISESRFKENPAQPARPGGVMVLLYPKDGDIYLPLMKRPVYEGAHSGQVSFPGGKVEKQDKNLVDTALRETHEEIGVLPHDIQVIGQLSELFIIASNFKVFPTVGILKNEPDFIPDEREVDRVLLPNLSHLKDSNNRGMKTMKFPPYTINSPYFDVEGEIVWGATAMILSELIHIVEDLGS